MTVTCPTAVEGNDDEVSPLGDKGDWLISCPETVESGLVDTVPITPGNGAASGVPAAVVGELTATAVAADVSEELERELRIMYIC